MSEHTKEPWGYIWIDQRTSSEEQACGMLHNGTDYIPFVATKERNGFANKADLARIVACVNACAGIPTERLASVVEENKWLRAALELISKKHEWQINEIRALTKAALAGGGK